jgi:2-oxoglutarate dehydrogenase E1 component
MSTRFDFTGPNAAYVRELYERFRENPETVDEKTRQFFSRWSPPLEGNGRVTTTLPAASVPTKLPTEKIVGVVNYAQSIRGYGHLGARLDPLGTPSPGDPALEPETHNLTEEDLRQLPGSLVSGPVGQKAYNAWEAVQRLQTIYSGSIGYDNDHISVPEERDWLREAAETGRFHPSNTPINNQKLLKRLVEIEVFEDFLQKQFPSKYRFSIEGLDMMVPMLDEMILRAAEEDIFTIQIGMAHRGRLNVMAHVLNKPYGQILAEFKDQVQPHKLEDYLGWTGDVKYHRGILRSIDDDSGVDLVVTVPPNPSHLELVNPVAVGMARAAGSTVDKRGAPEFDPTITLPLLIHGDAAFPGQGVVAETLNLSQLDAYWTGGTIHIIANNQIGFTTLPGEGRSTPYASDLAKGYRIPVVHVNADDPEACIAVARMAYAYRARFHKDFVIDLIGYRRYGHNELDEPRFTQPEIYERVNNHPRVREIWTGALVQRGEITQVDIENMVQSQYEDLQTLSETLEADDFVDHAMPSMPPEGEAKRVPTNITAEKLLQLSESLANCIPESFKVNSKLQRTLRKRHESLTDDEITLDWATAEELALASILADGTAIRLTGQDTERGTFSHRHAVLHDAETGERFIPLQAIPEAQAAFEISNSPLSESAALGFEYGYNVQRPERLVLWEAQYGDFINNAQSIIDEFLTSARAKWGLTPSLVLLLPHGYEGAGPDHSSARLERFLSLAAKKNVRIAYPTRTAQYFHLLRRQAALLNVDPLPLVIMTPKSLLRNPQIASSLEEFTEGRWRPVIDDEKVEDPAKIKRLLMCSGKFFLDLDNSQYRAQRPDVAIVRVEQLYPLPIDEIAAVLERYPNLEKIIWCQEEPKNMGAWDFINWRLERITKDRWPLYYVGRRRSSSPAEGSSNLHKINQGIVLNNAYNWQPGQQTLY